MMECGVFDGKTNGDGIATVNWVAHSTAPKALLATRAYRSGDTDDATGHIICTIRDVGTNTGNIRLRNLITRQWQASSNVSFHWAAFW